MINTFRVRILVCFLAVGILLPFACLASLTGHAACACPIAPITKVYAPPMIFGSWRQVHSHLNGPNTVTITVTPVGSTVVTGEVRYWNKNNNQVVETFTSQAVVEYGNSVGNISVRLKGTPTGSSCDVQVQ